MDLYFQGLAWLNKGLTPDNVAQARGFFDRALTADPDNVDALVGSAARTRSRAYISFVTDPMAAFAAAEAKLTKALSSVPDHAARPYVHWELSTYVTKRAAQGIAECEHALALDRNLASAHSLIGFGKIFVGRAEETEAHIAEALRLSPRDTMAYTWMFYAGLAKFHLGSYEQAVAWFRRSIEANRNFPHTHFAVGRRARAAWSTGRGAFRRQGRSRAQPDLHHLPRSRRSGRRCSDDPTYLAQLEPIFEGMRKAGVPEQ